MLLPVSIYPNPHARRASPTAGISQRSHIPRPYVYTYGYALSPAEAAYAGRFIESLGSIK